ncbi:DMT family transporter [Roseovarius sp. 2305UL8-3]|uniref:DMT family transporter n=1 Tax=Roseovarius conchicola TaxID=3121636 RepID=UPI003529A055
MTTLTPNSSHSAASNPMQGISCVLIAMIFFVTQDVLMKTLLDTYPIWMLLFIRSLVTAIILVPLILYLGGDHRLLSPLWPIHLVRGALFVAGFAMFYTAFPFMGLAEVTTIFFSAPLFTAILAAVWLKEQIGPHRIGALLLGFIGVVIAMNPAGDGFSWIAILPLTCAISYAMMQVLARQIGDRETSLTVGLNTLGVAGILILPVGWLVNQLITPGPDFPHLRLAFPLDRVQDIPQLLLLALVGMVGWVLLSRAYQVASASLVAPFDYTYLPLAALVAYLLFDEVPAGSTLIGMALIIIGGLYLGYRELKAVQTTDDPALVAEGLYAPGNPIPPHTTDDDLVHKDRPDDGRTE